MKNRASGFVKQMINAIVDIARAKTMALKTKTRAFRTRLVMFSLLHNRKILITSISQKLHALTAKNPHKKEEEDSTEAEEKTANAMVVYGTNAMKKSLMETEGLEFEEDEGVSVIEMAKNSKEDKGEEFRLEDEIDRVADLFINRFHRQIWMQKQLSFKRNHQQDQMLRDSSP